MNMGFFPFDMFDAFFALFPLLFLLAFGIIAFFLIKSVIQWSRNNAQPRIPAHARVVAKRTSVSRHQHSGANGHPVHTHTTTCYAAFEYLSGDRVELVLPESEFGLLAEGDEGTLTVQGTRYISFERNRE